MRVILNIALNELRLNFKDPGIWINLVILPIVISVAVAFANGQGAGGPSEGPRLMVDVIDNDGGALSEQLLDDVRAANTRIVLCPMDNNEENICGLEGGTLTPELAQQRLEDQTALAQIVIPEGFTGSISSEQPASIFYRSNEDITAPGYILQAVQAATQRLGGVQAAVSAADDTVSDLPILQFSDAADRAAFDQRVREQAQTLWESDPVQVEFVQAALDPETQSSGGAGFRQSIPGIGSMYVMFTVLPLASAIILERRQGTLQRLVTMPVTRTQILGGKLVARFVMGMIQFGVLFGFGLIMGVRFGDDPVALILLMAAFTSCITALALALTTLLKNPAQAEGVTLFLSITLAPLGGAWWPLDIVTEPMRIIGHISPIAWAMDGFNSLIFYNGSLGTVIVPVLVLLAMAAAFFTFGVVRFKFD